MWYLERRNYTKTDFYVSHQEHHGRASVFGARDSDSCSTSTWSLGQHPYFYRQLDSEMFKSENSDKMTTKTSMLTMTSNHFQNQFRSKLFIILNKLSGLFVAWTACSTLKWETTLRQISMCLIKSIMDELQSLEHVTRTLVQHPPDLWANIPICSGSSIVKCSKVKIMTRWLPKHQC